MGPMSHILSFLGSKDTHGYRSCARAVGHIAALNFFQTPVAILRIGREKTGPQTAPRLQERPFSHSPALMQCGAAVTMTKDRVVWPRSCSAATRRWTDRRSDARPSPLGRACTIPHTLAPTSSERG